MPRRREVVRDVRLQRRHLDRLPDACPNPQREVGPERGAPLLRDVFHEAEGGGQGALQQDAGQERRRAAQPGRAPEDRGRGAAGRGLRTWLGRSWGVREDGGAHLEQTLGTSTETTATVMEKEPKIAPFISGEALQEV